MAYTYKYPRPAVTADCIVITKEAEPKVLLLNSFLKKSTKQYKGEIEIARQIMNKYIGGQEDDED